MPHIDVSSLAHRLATAPAVDARTHATRPGYQVVFELGHVMVVGNFSSEAGAAIWRGFAGADGARSMEVRSIDG